MSKKLSTESVFEKLGITPLRDIIYVDENSGELIVNGKVADIELMKQLHGSAQAALGSKALNLIREQVAYEATNQAVRKVKTPEELTFYRAALWWGEQELKILKLLAQQTDVREEESLS